MAANNRRGPHKEVDLEATDELPALNLAEVGESQVNTDIFPGAGHSRRDGRTRRQPARR